MRAWLVLGLASASAAAWAQSPERPETAPGSANPTGAMGLTEDEAVRRALANPDLAELRDGLVAEAEAEGRARTTWQNPQFQYTREQLLTGDVVGEDYATLSQTFDLSGRRGLHRKAAAARGDAAKQHAAIAAADLAAHTRHSFYRVLAGQDRLEVLRRWEGQVSSQLAQVTRREAAGDAAAYDRLRLQRELTRVSTLVQREEVMVRASWARLRGLMERDAATAAEVAPPALAGTLLPATTGGEAAAGHRVPAAPELRVAEAEARALELDSRVAGRAWVPNPSLGGGYKGVDLPGGGRSHGFVINLGIPLPVLNRGQASRAQARAQTRSLEAETNLTRTRAQAEVDALAEEVDHLAQLAGKMGRRNTEDDALLTAAESGYRGGEIGVMELIDAYRSSAEAQLLAIDLELSARTAEVELRRWTEEQP